MEITYQPIEQQDVEKIFAYLKELVLRYGADRLRKGSCLEPQKN